MRPALKLPNIFFTIGLLINEGARSYIYTHTTQWDRCHAHTSVAHLAKVTELIQTNAEDDFAQQARLYAACRSTPQWLGIATARIRRLHTTVHTSITRVCSQRHTSTRMYFEDGRERRHDHARRHCQAHAHRIAVLITFRVHRLFDTLWENDNNIHHKQNILEYTVSVTHIYTWTHTVHTCRMPLNPRMYNILVGNCVVCHCKIVFVFYKTIKRNRIKQINKIKLECAYLEKKMLVDHPTMLDSIHLFSKSVFI